MSVKNLSVMSLGQNRPSVGEAIERFLQENKWERVYNGPRLLVNNTARVEAVRVIDDEGVSGVVEPENSINGAEMLHRMRLISTINKEDAVAILDHPEAIPEDWKGKYFLTSFVCKDGGGRLRVLFFCWSDGCWGWYFGYSDDGFDSDDRFVRPATGLVAP